MSPASKDLWQEVSSFEGLLRASARAARGKKHVRAVARWLADLEPNCLALAEELRQGLYRPARPTTFAIHDPKTRTISAAPFRDRVVHHALMDALEPQLEAAMLPHSFACRKGKGLHRALARARALVRAHDWFLKLDIASFFASLEHDVVLEALARIVYEPRVLGLAECIVRHGDGTGSRPVGDPPRSAKASRGLPIGNLTSQWLANWVLDRVDRFIVEDLGIDGLARYRQPAIQL